jgi:hypothetical protein
MAEEEKAMKERQRIIVGVNLSCNNFSKWSPQGDLRRDDKSVLDGGTLGDESREVTNP